MWRRRIYMDYAGATPPSKNSLKETVAAYGAYGNPGSLHREGLKAKELLDSARRRIARVIECRESEVVFTSGGTESNNLAILGVVEALLPKRVMHSMHFITSTIEHASVLEPFRMLERAGARVTYVQPQENGRIKPEDIHTALTPSTVLVSIGWANSEIGTVQPLHAVAAQIREYTQKHDVNIFFHSDAGQAPLHLSPIMSGLGVDMLTLDSGKLYAPRGVGALIVRRQVHLSSIMRGGGQEKELRPGTEPVALACGFARALEEADIMRKEESARMRELRRTFIAELQKQLSDFEINGDEEHTLPHIVNISVRGIDPEYVVFLLDKEGIAIATKSACEEGARESHVVKSCFPESELWRAQTTLRFSFGRDTTVRKTRRVAASLKGAIALSRKNLQLYK